MALSHIGMVAWKGVHIQQVCHLNHNCLEPPLELHIASSYDANLFGAPRQRRKPIGRMFAFLPFAYGRYQVNNRCLPSPLLGICLK